MELSLSMAIVSPNSKWMSIDDTYEKLQMLDGSEKPTLEELESVSSLVEEKKAKILAKAEATKLLETLTVTTSKGNTFDANNQARLDMQNAITASDFVGVTQITWRMADDSEVLIELNELKEALVLAIQEYARIKGIA